MSNEEYKDKFISEIYDEFLSNVNKFKEILEEYFGEENVDFQDVITKTDLENTIFNESYNPFLNIKQYLSLDKSNEVAVKQFYDNLLSNKRVILSKLLCHIDSCITVLIHFPKITVTNEYDISTDITELYVRLQLLYSGRIVSSFTMNRTEYTKKQYNTGYLHSHCPAINKNNLSLFLSPCLGSGPIRATVTSMARAFNEDTIRLFCVELGLYVRTESIEGIPYIKLENIGNFSENSYNLDECFDNKYNNPKLYSFITWFIKNTDFKFYYDGYVYKLAMSFKDFFILCSNSFIRWYNSIGNKTLTIKSLKEDDTIIEGRLHNGLIFYNPETSIINNILPDKIHILTFKGEPKYLNIIKNESIINSYSTFLNLNSVHFIETVILNIINYGICTGSNDCKEAIFM